MIGKRPAERNRRKRILRNEIVPDLHIFYKPVLIGFNVRLIHHEHIIHIQHELFQRRPMPGLDVMAVLSLDEPRWLAAVKYPHFRRRHIVQIAQPAIAELVSVPGDRIRRFRVKPRTLPFFLVSIFHDIFKNMPRIPRITLAETGIEHDPFLIHGQHDTHSAI